jgi:LPS-assembly lipoprotein
MWSCDRRAALAALAAVAVGGCGFRPLYGPDAAGGSGMIGQIDVVQPPGRDGYHYQRALRRRLGDAGADPAYALETTLRFDQRETAITVDADVTRYDILGAAEYRLIPTGAAEPVLTGAVEAVSAYTTLAAPYATAVAERDARRRVAEALAVKVQGALASALSRLPDQPA